MENRIELGCVYEISHAHLPQRTPAQVRSIRVVMVCEKTEMYVAVKYPSKESLRAFFSYSMGGNHPALDEKFVMGIALADKVLIRLVPVGVLYELKSLKDFWLLSSDSFTEDCLSRVDVQYLGLHREFNDDKNVYVRNYSSSFVNGGDEALIVKSEKEEEDFVDEGVKLEDGDAENEEEEKEEKIMVNENLKRKRYSFRNIIKKEPKGENQTRKKSRATVLRTLKDRWSSNRYKLAEQHLIEVMKAKRATARKPILRPQLRAEARKKIGDTGLLDHLLKHMAGKLAPGGEHRFRRRHNSDGAMEYWLESADIVDVTSDAEVSDAYWVLKLENVRIGEPKEGEIKVKNKAIGLNSINIYTPGFEAAGVIIAVGPGLTEPKVGDLVAYVGKPIGSYAEEQILPAENVIPLPYYIDPIIAASVLLKGMTAQFLVRRCFKVEPEHTVLIHAAAGGVGSLLCQWANACGATVIGTVSTKVEEVQAREDGCHHVIEYNDEDFVARVNKITFGKGVDVVYDSVGKDTFEGSLACLKLRGYMVSFGQSSGTPEPVHFSALAAKSLFLTRPSLMQYNVTRNELIQATEELFTNVALGVLQVRVNQTYPLDQAAQAHADLESRKTPGFVLLVPDRAKW